MGFFKTKLEKDYKKLSKEYEVQKLEEKVRKLEHENMLLKHDFENCKFDLDHLKESTFIRSFVMKSGNGQWQRPIMEADEVACGNSIKQSNSELNVDDIKRAVDSFNKFLKSLENN